MGNGVQQNYLLQTEMFLVPIYPPRNRDWERFSKQASDIVLFFRLSVELLTLKRGSDGGMRGEGEPFQPIEKVPETTFPHPWSDLQSHQPLTWQILNWSQIPTGIPRSRNGTFVFTERWGRGEAQLAAAEVPGDPGECHFVSGGTHCPEQDRYFTNLSEASSSSIQWREVPRGEQPHFNLVEEGDVRLKHFQSNGPLGRRCGSAG